MLYGEEKRHHMARSILPSTRSKWARWKKRNKNKQKRHRVKQDLRRCLFDEEHAYEADLNFEPRWGFYLSERREADKLSHFEKWAIQITQHIEEPDGRLAFMRSILPPGLIGWHALQHLENYKEFRANSFAYSYDGAEARAKLRLREAEKHRLRILGLREVVEAPGGHKALNSHVRGAHRMVTWKAPGGGEYEVGPSRPRLLRGYGDIDTFLDDLYKAANRRAVKVDPFLITSRRRAGWGLGKDHSYNWETVVGYQTNPERHPEWLDSVDRFLAAWRKDGDASRVRERLSKTSLR